MKICIFGASPDTGNLGVTALGYSVLRGIWRMFPGAEITVFDYGSGVREERIVNDGDECSFSRSGAYMTRRYYRSESLDLIRILTRLGASSGKSHARLREADLVLDASGGDSFSDIYGRRRFRSVTLGKLATLELRRPLVLLPQTYGPFQSPRVRRVARQIIERADQVWARDPWSHASLQGLLGDSFDARRHRQGVDVAFDLEAKAPPDERCEILKDWIQDSTGVPIIGLNVSGLLLNRPALASGQYGLRAEYGAVISSLIERLLSESTAKILLVPHVCSSGGVGESDLEACESIRASIRGLNDERVRTMPQTDDPRLAKWWIAKTDWFCGTRMHSTIAAMSSGVPTAGIAYSPKMHGVFETCGQASSVVDPRESTTKESIEALMKSWRIREDTRISLRSHLPKVLETAQSQLESILLGSPQCGSPSSTEAPETASTSTSSASGSSGADRVS